MSKQAELAQNTASILRDAGHTVFYAGGAVRDQLLGREPKDYDLATSATPKEVQALFPKSDSVGEHFGVILVKHQREAVEVATFRSDGVYENGRSPESVTFSSPEEDAQRRDFTVNGLFQDPFSGETSTTSEAVQTLKPESSAPSASQKSASKKTLFASSAPSALPPRLDSRSKTELSPHSAKMPLS